MCPALRVFEIEPIGKVTRVSPQAPHIEIDKSLETGKVLFNTEFTQSPIQHQVRVLPAPSPHNPGFHEVWWLNEKTQSKDIYWDSQSEQRVLTNPLFLAELEKSIHLAQKNARLTNNLDLRAYMYWGFTLPDFKNGTKESVIWRGLQTQPRFHWHLSQGIDAHQSPTDWLHLSQKENTSYIARFLNLAGDFILMQNPRVLSQFGESFTYPQPLQGNWPNDMKERTFFAFPSLVDAVQASIQLRSQVIDHWFAMAQSVHEHSPFMYAGALFSMFQSAVPNFIFIKPNESDKKIAKRSIQTDQNDSTETWVAAFSVVGAPEMLTDGGLHLRRPIVKNK